MTFYEVWRALNMLLAITGALIFLQAKVMPKWFLIPLDQKLGMATLLLYPIGYFIATAVAWANTVPAGPWTGVMGVPVITGFAMSWVKDER